MSKMGKYVSEWFDAGLVVYAKLFACAVMLVAGTQYEMELVRIRTGN